MTEERKDLLLSIFSEDPEFVKEIIPQGISEMTKAINKKGYDFTESEIEEFGEFFKEIVSKCVDENGEISEEMLDSVAGGKMSTGDKIKACIGIALFIGLAVAVSY